MKVSSLAYLCYRIVVSDQSERDAQKTLCMPKLHLLWQKHQKMYCDIETLAKHAGGTIYGGYVRDSICLDVLGYYQNG